MNSSNQTKLSLALTLAVCLYSQSAFAATNTGGVADQPTANDYTGSLDGTNITNTGGNVTINTDVAGDVYGGYSDTSAASSNQVTVNDGIVRSVVGGSSKSGAANNNIVTINGGTITSVAGGEANGVSANNNTVNINGGNISSNVFGAVSDDRNITVVVSGNTVNVNGGIIDAELYGGSGGSNSDVIGNTVNIMQGSVQQEIYGGVGDKGNVSGNKVLISGGSITGGVVIGGMSPDGNVSNNTVEISGGNINTDTMIVAGTGDGTISIVGNSVIIKGGNFSGDVQIYGGYGDDPTAINNNTLTIEGTPTFAANPELYGGFQVSGAADIRTGNTLNVYMSGLNAKTVDNFQHYDLALDNKNTTTLTVTDALTLQANDTIRATRVLNELNIGDTVKVLESTGGLDLNGATLVNGKAKQGALYIYGYELSQDANGVVVADILSKETNKQTMSVADGQLAAMGMLRSGADLISGSAMTTAAQNANHYDVFAAMNYGNYHMNSVSNIDVQGTSMLVGMSRSLQHTNSNTTIGAFLESGWGTYDSELGEARAKGHTNYYGLGVLARHNQDSGIYTEGSLRVGKVGNTYSGHSADDGSYDASSTYYGLHLGIGKIHKLNDTTNIDYYGKYFYAHESGTDATLLGDKFDFDSIDSHRIRIGARLNNTNKNITRYVGLAYEYEFSGTAKASAYGMDIASPSAKGSSGLLELGLTYKPATDSRFSMDMGLTGYAGKRQGVSGNVNLNWAF